MEAHRARARADAAAAEKKRVEDEKKRAEEAKEKARRELEEEKRREEEEELANMTPEERQVSFLSCLGLMSLIDDAGNCEQEIGLGGQGPRQCLLHQEKPN
jgi:hypothetical protein